MGGQAHYTAVRRTGPAKSIPSLVEWTPKEAKPVAPKSSGQGKDADPLLVLTEAALERYGLPVALTEEERLAGRIPEGHTAAVPEEYLESCTTDPATWMRTPENLKRLAALTREADARWRASTERKPEQPADVIGPRRPAAPHHSPARTDRRDR